MSQFAHTMGPAQPQFPALPSARDTTPATGEENWISLADLLRTINVRWREILLVGCITGGLATAGVFLMTPKYQGAALVMVDEQQSHVVDDVNDPAVLSELPSDPSSIASQVEVLQSRALAGEVVDNLKLVDDEEFNGEKNDLINAALRLVRSLDVFGLTADKTGGLSATQKKREKVIDTFLRRLDVNSLGHSTIIEVDFLSESATKSARIANAIADTYVKNQMATKSKAGEGASQWLTDRVAQLSRQASAATAAVQQYKAEHGLVDTSTGTALTDQEMGNLIIQLITAEGNQAQAQAKLTQMRQLVSSGHGADVTQVVDLPAHHAIAGAGNDVDPAGRRHGVAIRPSQSEIAGRRGAVEGASVEDQRRSKPGDRDRLQ